MGHGRYRFGVKALVPALAFALLLPAAARAGARRTGVAEGALAVARDGSPRVAWVDGRRLVLASRSAAWSSAPIATLPSLEGRVAGLAENAVLVEGRRSWIRLVVRSGNRWRVVKVADAPKRALLGVSGLTLDAARRPAVAYAIQEADDKTSLYLARLGADGRLRTTRMTRNGFPSSVLPPAAMPVLWPDRTVRVVQSFSQRGANAILWRREGAPGGAASCTRALWAPPPSPSTPPPRPAVSTSSGRSPTRRSARTTSSSPVASNAPARPSCTRTPSPPGSSSGRAARRWRRTRRSPRSGRGS